MIKFFRKIRQQLMAEKKIGKYILYAVGEIVLVVIGIMIAVALNNNNQLKKTKAEEQSYLLALKEEFQFNKDRLAYMTKRNTANLNASLELLEFVSPETPQLAEDKFDEMLQTVLMNEVQFSPSPGVLNEIINSGKLGSFSDPELKKAFGAWEAELIRVKFQEEEEVQRARSELIKFANIHSNIRRGVARSRFAKQIGISNSKFKGQNQMLLQMEAFENSLMDVILVSYFLNTSYYSPLDKQIDELLSLIDANIDKK